MFSTEDAERPLATLLVHGHVGLHMYCPSDMGSHTNVGSCLLRHWLSDEILMGLCSIYTTGLTKYALCMDIEAEIKAKSVCPV